MTIFTNSSRATTDRTGQVSDFSKAGVSAIKAASRSVDGAIQSWSCRSMNLDSVRVSSTDHEPPRVGDVALVEVDSISNHTRVVTSANERRRLYLGDHLIGVFGNRYATDAFEGELSPSGELSILTNAGLLGTVVSQNRNVKNPSRVSMRGYLCDAAGDRINLKSLLFRPSIPGRAGPQVVLVVGTGMNSGKTTTAARLVRELVCRQHRVVACKVTGSVSHGDLFEFRSASPSLATDFSDYGFPSTYLCDPDELGSLFHSMVADAQRVDPDVIVMEVADGVLQRETAMLLHDPAIRAHVAGVVLTAPCALSAIEGVRRIESAGHSVVAVSGIITNAPLFVREFRSRIDVPVCRVGGGTDCLTEVLANRLALESQSEATRCRIHVPSVRS